MGMLESRGEGRYDCFVPATAGTGRENPMILGALALLYGAFFMLCPPMAGDVGQSERAGRVPSSRFLTPISSATISVRRAVADSNLTRSPL